MELWDGTPPGYNPTIPQRPPSLQLCREKERENGGAMIVCPGGGYAHKAPHEGEPVGRWLNSIGIAAFILDYRVHPYRHPWPLTDAARAVRYLRHNAVSLGIDPDRIGIMGFSAGGHLAASAGVLHDAGDPDAADPVNRVGSRPDAMVLCYPVISFGRYRHHGSMVNLLGPRPNRESRSRLSLENSVSVDTPPAFIWHTADDGAVPVMNSLDMARAMFLKEVPFELHIFPHGRHGLGLAEKDPVVGAWTGLCRTWLSGLGFS